MESRVLKPQDNNTPAGTQPARACASPRERYGTIHSVRVIASEARICKHLTNPN